MTDTQPRPFDERAALEELERLADKIQSTRRQRERAVADFNAFVKTFKDEDHAARWSALQAPARASTGAVALAPPPPPAAPAAAERRTPETTAPPVPPAAFDSEPESMAWSAPRGGIDVAALLRTPRGRLAAGAALAGVVLVVGWLLSGSGGGSGATPPADGAPAAAAAAQSQAPAAAPAAPSQPTPVASSGPPRAVNVVLMTSRPVWTRVIVDDRKVIEREIPGGQTIPLGADRAIAIRAGDAGAIRVIVDGKDLGALGRDGQIASRLFSAPKAR